MQRPASVTYLLTTALDRFGLVTRFLRFGLVAGLLQVRVPISVPTQGRGVGGLHLPGRVELEGGVWLLIPEASGTLVVPPSGGVRL